MEAIVLLVSILMALCLALLRGGTPRVGRVNAMFAVLAKRWHGRMRRGGPFRRPAVSFQHGHAQAEVSWCSEQPEFVVLRIDWPELDFRVRVTESEEPGMVMRHPLLENRVGLNLLTNDEQRARTFFSPEVLETLDQLRHLAEQRLIELAVRGGVLAIRVYGRPLSAAYVSRVVELGLDLFDLAQLGNAFGIDWVGCDIADESVCCICGEKIETNLVQCRRCRTPHHLECWKYNGACSTYGCQEGEFTVPVDGKADQVRLP